MTEDLITLSLDEKAEEWVYYVFGGVHKVSKFEKQVNHYVCVPYGSLATYDDDVLTKIVLASHTLGLRAEITNNGMRGLKILLHNRIGRTGRLYERHPEISEAIKNYDRYKQITGEEWC
jgi:hypothetical protein